MALRKELQLPIIDEGKLSEVKELIDIIAVSLEEKVMDVKENGQVIFDSIDIEKLVKDAAQRLEELTHKKINFMEFDSYWSHSDLEDVAIELLCPEPEYVKDISEDELTELLEEFVTLEHIQPEHEEYYIELLAKSFGLSDISDYIFWPNTKGMKIDAESREIARKIIEDSKNS